MNDDVEAALDALTAEARSIHRACLRLLARSDQTLADDISQTHSQYFDLAGTSKDPANLSYAALLKRLGPIAGMVPPIVVATVLRSSLSAATGPLGERWLVVIPAGVISFYRTFCNIVFLARESYIVSQELEGPIKGMSDLLGEQLEFGTLNF